VKPTRQALERPRLLRMDIPDLADERDFDFDAAEKATPELLKTLEPQLAELESMLRGRDSQYDDMPTLNAWGLSMDDALVLPILRSLTCVKGLEMPPLVEEYTARACEKAGVPLFTEMAS